MTDPASPVHFSQEGASAVTLKRIPTGGPVPLWELYFQIGDEITAPVEVDVPQVLYDKIVIGQADESVAIAHFSELLQRRYRLQLQSEDANLIIWAVLGEK